MILDSIIGLGAHVMEKIRSLIGIHYQLQNNGAVFLYHLSDWHTLLDLDLDKILNPINLSYSYFLISLHNILV